MSLNAEIKKSLGDFSLDVEFETEERGVTGIFGRSGAGKTTLLRCIAGLESPDSGRISFGESTWFEDRVTIPVHKRRIGYVSQKASLFPHLTVRENIEYGCHRFKDPISRVIDFPGISELLGRNPETLSGGEKQRVAIARALAINPRLLLMDEPLASLDEESKAEILPFLSTLLHGIICPVLYVSHNVSEMAKFADRILCIDQGKVTGFGPASEILTRLDLSPAQSTNAISFIEATAKSFDEEFGISELVFAGGSIFVTDKVHEKKRLRIQIDAGDVSIALSKPESTSIQNVLPATIDELIEIDGHRVLVRLLVGRQPILASITRKSLHSLSLTPGMNVFAQVKSVSLQN